MVERSSCVLYQPRQQLAGSARKATAGREGPGKGLPGQIKGLKYQGLPMDIRTLGWRSLSLSHAKSGRKWLIALGLLAMAALAEAQTNPFAKGPDPTSA